MFVACKNDILCHPCCMERLPLVINGNKDVFASGHYELSDESGAGTREGKVMIFALKEENSSVSVKTLADICCGDSGGVLDLKLINSTTLATAMSGERLDFYLINTSLDNDSTSILQKCKSMSKAGEGLFLSIDSFPSEGSSIVACSTQSGSLVVYQYNQTGIDEILYIPNAHILLSQSMPVWITALDPHSKTLILSGGDDCKFKLWDMRNFQIPVAVCNKFDAGVTSSQWHPHKEHVFAVGSYDETVSLWDVRNLKTELLRSNTGGGVWRVKWSPDSNFGSYDYLLTANMQGGSSLLKFSSDLSSNESITFNMVDNVTRSSGSSQQLVYGACFLRNSDVGKDIQDFWIGTSSFYENRFDIWGSKF